MFSIGAIDGYNICSWVWVNVYRLLFVVYCYLFYLAESIAAIIICLFYAIVINTIKRFAIYSVVGFYGC